MLLTSESDWRRFYSNENTKSGSGLISDIIFTDNSSWQRSRRFRLGARPVTKNYSEARIREARSEAFMVKDHRGECKFKPLTLALTFNFSSVYRFSIMNEISAKSITKN